MKIHSHPEILQAYTVLFKDTSEGLKQVSNPDEKSNNDSWSIREEMEHLVISGRMVASALKVPKMVLRSFGKPNREVRDYDTTFQRYKDRLQEVGPVSNSPASPKKDGDNMVSLLKQWDEIGEKFAKRLQKWNDKDLDNYLLPHPLMGKILVREMLFFTHFHSLHHFERIVGRANL